MGLYTRALCSAELCLTQNSCVEALAPIVTVFADGVWKVTELNEIVRWEPHDEINVEL